MGFNWRCSRDDIIVEFIPRHTRPVAGEGHLGRQWSRGWRHSSGPCRERRNARRTDSSSGVELVGALVALQNCRGVRTPIAGSSDEPPCIGVDALRDEDRAVSGQKCRRSRLDLSRTDASAGRPARQHSEPASSDVAGSRVPGLVAASSAFPASLPPGRLLLGEVLNAGGSRLVRGRRTLSRQSLCQCAFSPR